MEPFRNPPALGRSRRLPAHGSVYIKAYATPPSVSPRNHRVVKSRALSPAELLQTRSGLRCAAAVAHEGIAIQGTDRQVGEPTTAEVDVPRPWCGACAIGRARNR